MAEEKLPLELIADILSLVPPKSLARFRIVSKKWNALFDDKNFINNHKKTFRFILTTKSKIYSVSIDPKIVVLELTLDTPGLGSQIPVSLFDCNEFLLCGIETGAMICNPWLKQIRLINQDLSQTRMKICGVGKNNDGSYKMIVSCNLIENPIRRVFGIYDFVSDSWKYYESESGNSLRILMNFLHRTKPASLNGNLYWVFGTTNHIVKFNLSSNTIFIKFCYLPCGGNELDKDALVLSVFKRDRFSLLKQCHKTKKIETWVSKNKINSNVDSDDVEWVKFIEVSSPNLPDLVYTNTTLYSQPSYFMEDKRLVVCSCDETGLTWIYVFESNSFISKTHIASVVDSWPSHCTFIPSLAPVPRSQREEPAEP